MRLQIYLLQLVLDPPECVQDSTRRRQNKKFLKINMFKFVNDKNRGFK